MEFLNPIALILVLSLAFLVVGWFLLSRFGALLCGRKEDQSLQAIVLGLRGLKVEERSKEVTQYLSRLRGDLAKFWDGFSWVEKHLGRVHVSYQTTEKRVEQLGQRLLFAGRTRSSSNFVATVPKWDS